MTVEPVNAGETHDFSISLKTPAKTGKSISYWRMTAPNGYRFGHKIWVDIDVIAAEKPKEPVAEVKVVPVSGPSDEQDTLVDVSVKEDQTPKNADLLSSSSQMIFPTLDKESPVSSIHHDQAAPAPYVMDDDELFSEVESIASFPDDEDTFLTDEEYDILDASDEEFLAEAQKAVQK
jgi:next-to-BRCA1 protein 1